MHHEDKTTEYMHTIIALWKKFSLNCRLPSTVPFQSPFYLG